MYTVTPQQINDIHLLNEQFLNLVSASESASDFGLPDDVFSIIRSWSSEQIKQVARTDILLFSFGDAKGDAEKPCSCTCGTEWSNLVENLNIVARNFAYTAPGFASTHLGLSRETANRLCSMGTAEIQETSRKSPNALRIIPLGGVGFRVLGSIDSVLERTRYVALAANDACM